MKRKQEIVFKNSHRRNQDIILSKNIRDISMNKSNMERVMSSISGYKFKSLTATIDFNGIPDVTAYTNGYSIYVNANFNNMLEKDELAPEHTLALLMHESAHVGFTYMPSKKNMAEQIKKKKLNNMPISVLFNLYNIFEDGRIEHILYTNYKLFFQNVKDLNLYLFKDSYNEYLKNPKIDNYHEFKTSILNMIVLRKKFNYDDYKGKERDFLKELYSKYIEFRSDFGAYSSFEKFLGIAKFIYNFYEDEFEKQGENNKKIQDIIDALSIQIETHGTPGGNNPGDLSEEEGSEIPNGISIQQDCENGENLDTSGEELSTVRGKKRNVNMTTQPDGMEMSSDDLPIAYEMYSQSSGRLTKQELKDASDLSKTIKKIEILAKSKEISNSGNFEVKQFLRQKTSLSPSYDRIYSRSRITSKYGFDLFLMIDLSGSMSGKGEDVAYKTAASLEYAIKLSGEDFRIRCAGYDSEGIRVMKTLEDKTPSQCSIIKGSKANARMMNSDAAALEYAINSIKLNKGLNPVIVMIVDGMPMRSDEDKISRLSKKARSEGISVVPIFIHTSYQSKETILDRLRRIYALKEDDLVLDADDKQELIKNFEKVFTKHMKDINLQ